MSCTVETFLKSYEKYGLDCILWKEKDFRDLKTVNPKSPYDCTYINIYFKDADTSTLSRFKLNIYSQLTGSGAKLPQANSTEDVSSMSIQFKKLTLDDIRGGDNVPKVKNTPQEQEIENKRVETNNNILFKNNQALCRVLDIVNQAYIKCANEIIAASKAKKLQFSVNKNRGNSEVKINTMVQSTRLDMDTKEEVPLENPIYRIQIPVDRKTGIIGNPDYKTGNITPIIFDARKSNQSKGFKPVPATLKVDGVETQMNIKTCSEYITYKSIVTGVIDFNSFTISKAGISLSRKFTELYVIRNKLNRKNETASVSVLESIRNFLPADSDSEESEHAVADGIDTDEDTGPVHNDTSDGEDIMDDDLDSATASISTLSASTILPTPIVQAEPPFQEESGKKPRKKKAT